MYECNLHDLHNYVMEPFLAHVLVDLDLLPVLGIHDFHICNINSTFCCSMYGTVRHSSGICELNKSKIDEHAL